MTTTTRKTPRKGAKAPANEVPQTLEQFDAALDAHLGYPAGFADAVVRLWDTRQQLAQIKEARALIHDRLKELYVAGHTTVDGTVWQIKQTTPGVPQVYRAVDSATVKKHAKPAWERAQAVVSYVQVKAPARVVPTQVEVPALTPRQAAALTPAAAVALYKDHPAWQWAKVLREQEADLVAHLDKVAAQVGDWDGLPVTFADGWSAGLRRRQFSAEKLRELEPEVFDKLAVTKVRQAAARVYVGKPGADDATDLDGD